MRSDMSKVLTECYRWNSSGQSINVRQSRTARRTKSPEQLESLPKREGMLCRPFGGRKEFGENLNPLKKFLYSRVGRLWDDVYSEISANLNRNSATHNHIFQHIWGYVENHVLKDEKGLYTVHSYVGRSYLRNNELYIDDRGVLRKYSAPVRKKVKGELRFANRKGRRFAKKDGKWYEVILVPVPSRMRPLSISPESFKELTYEDCFFNVETFEKKYLWHHFGLRNYYCTEAKELTPGQLAHYRLQNT